MGNVYISDAKGNVSWQGRNTLMEAFEIELLSSIGGGGSPPLYCAVGSSYLPDYTTLKDEPWTQTQLQSEISRRPILGTYVDPLTGRVGLTTAFRTINAKATWRELGLYDVDEQAEYGLRTVTSCDSLNLGGGTSTLLGTEWYSDEDNTLTANPSYASEGFAALQCIGDEDLLFRNNQLLLSDSSLYTSDGALQFYLGVNDPTLLHSTNGVRVRLGLVQTATVDMSDYYQWTIDDSELVAGTNAISLPFSEASETGDADIGVFFGIDIRAVGRSAGMSFTLDRIRLFRASGVLYARTEINPPYNKPSDVNQMVTWVIEPFLEV